MISLDLYSVLLRFYPRRFRTQFAEEMKHYSDRLSRTEKGVWAAICYSPRRN